MVSKVKNTPSKYIYLLEWSTSSPDEKNTSIAGNDAWFINSWFIKPDIFD